jgi:hypothetical protein
VFVTAGPAVGKILGGQLSAMSKHAVLHTPLTQSYLPGQFCAVVHDLVCPEVQAPDGGGVGTEITIQRQHVPVPDVQPV